MDGNVGQVARALYPERCEGRPRHLGSNCYGFGDSTTIRGAGRLSSRRVGYFFFGFFFSRLRASLFPMTESCHRSPNFARASPRGSFQSGSNSLPSARTTFVRRRSGAPLFTGLPTIVMTSPGFSVFLFHPRLARRFGLLVSASHVTV